MSAKSFVEAQGCRLAYMERGTGPPIVFIQGTGVHGGGWDPQVAGLNANYRCVTFDNRGMGQSGTAQGRLSVEGMALDTLAVMDACGLADAHLAGHSLGGLVAQQVALTARNRVRSLALLCSFARGADATRLTRDLLWLGIRSRIGTRRMRRHAFLKIVVPEAVYRANDPDEMSAALAPLFGHDLADFPAVVTKQMSAMARCDLTSRTEELKGVPVLVIGAGLDRIARPAMIRALAAAVPGARLVEFPDAGHALPIHRSEEVNAVLKEHFDLAEETFQRGETEMNSDNPVR